MSDTIGIKDGETVKAYKKRKKTESKNQESNTHTKKETNNMNSIKSFSKTILPWLLIFAAICAGTGYFLGHTRGMEDQRGISATVQNEVAAQLKDEAK